MLLLAIMPDARRLRHRVGYIAFPDALAPVWLQGLCRDKYPGIVVNRGNLASRSPGSKRTGRITQKGAAAKPTKPDDPAAQAAR
jgi:hypothetical protein